MSTKDKITYVLLILTTLLAGIFAGGAFYEQFTLNSIWSANPPESFRLMNEWIVPGLEKHNFYILPPIVLLLTLVTTLIVVRRKTRYKSWLLVAASSMIILTIWTFMYFIPILTELFIKPDPGISNEKAAMLAGNWYQYNWGRIFLAFLTFYSLFRATINFKEMNPYERKLY